MELTVTLDLGPVEARFTGEDQEEVQQGILDFAEFVEENGEALDDIEAQATGDGTGEAEDRGARVVQAQESNDGGTSTGFGDIPARTGIGEATLGEHFEIDPTGEKPPRLDFDPDVLGESGRSRSEKQMRGSLILLTLWRECHGVEEVTSPELKDALSMSGIDDKNVFNMYGFNDGEGGEYFNRAGSGANTDIELKRAGERAGFDQIQRTVERIESGDE